MSQLREQRSEVRGQRSVFFVLESPTAELPVFPELPVLSARFSDSRTSLAHYKKPPCGSPANMAS